MSIKQPIYHEFDLNATSGNSRVISLAHTDDAHVDVIELCVKQQGAPVDLTGATVIARMVLHSTADVLLNDNVPCTINSAGNILIPFDNAAVQTRKGIVKIEVNITRDPDILTLQLPLWVKINGSILDDATVDPHSEGTIPELLKDAADALEEATHALEDAKDYDKLENKPQINSYTLSGNKSSDDLGLQKKLTAGQNITIGNDGTISASGSITSYNDLTDQPNISNYAPNQQEQVHPLTGTLDLYPFISSYNSSTKKNSLRLDSSQLFEAFKVPFTIYNFEDLPTSHGVFVCYYADSGYFTPLPDFIKPLYNFLVVYNLYTGTGQGLAQLLFWKDKNDGEAKSAFRVSAGNYNTVSPWREIGSGSQLVSAVVNQNGTITFTNSDGSTFTTSGSSVIGAKGDKGDTGAAGADGIGIADVHIDGGGDLIIEYTTGHMENVGHVVGADGQDYVLTSQDKSDIADIVLSELPIYNGGVQ